ncbi:MAG: polyprenyl synthetase family protein [Actinobacteria bacterium]|nr:polyprenyl synthetase family protein [Actinomycetota bacterium]
MSDATELSPPPSAGAAALEAVVRAGGTQLGALLDRTEERLVALAGGHGATLARHATATISAGGKRLRPLLVFLAAGEAPDGAAQARLVRAAVAVELIHSASLVHDDVLDAAALRRGAPTVVAAAGRTIATATGDLLFSRAFAELVEGGELADVRALSAAASALATGELMQRTDAWDAQVPVERYLRRCELKTGSLFEAACRLGALGGGAAAAEADALALFGRRIGLAFQLLDDVLDVSGPPERTGKARGTDLLDGTVTLPLILARERDAQLARIALRTLRTAQDAEEVCDRIAATGALAVAKERALAVVADARAGLPPLPPAQRDALELVAAGVVERYA